MIAFKDACNVGGVDFNRLNASPSFACFVGPALNFLFTTLDCLKKLIVVLVLSLRGLPASLMGIPNAGY